MQKIILSLAVVALVGCKPPQVLKQSIPVSSNPSGAEVSVDGLVVGKTPIRLHLERNENHIVTLRLAGYRQEDVVVKKVYQERTQMESIQAGVESAAFFGDIGMGMGSAMRSAKEKEATGEAYWLEPSAIAVVLHHD